MKLLGCTAAMLAGWLAACAPTAPAPSPSAAASGGTAAATGSQTAPAAFSSTGAPGTSTGATAAAPLPPRKVVIAYTSLNPNLLPVRLAVSEGLYLAEGLEPTLMQVGSSTYAPAMLNGELDYATHFGATVRLATAGAPVKALMVLNNKPIFYFIARPEIGSIPDLRGKPVGTGPRGGSLENYARDIFVHYGLDPQNDLAFLPFNDNHAQVAGMVAGQLYGAVVPLPFNFIAEGYGMKTLVDAADLFRVASGGLVATEQRMQERPDEVRAAIRATLKGMELARANRSLAVQQIVDWAGMAPDDADRAYEAVVKSFTTDGLATDAEIQPEIDNAKEQMGTPDAVIPMSQVVDFSFLRAVLAEQRR
jgi:NitT/TauT family transport system substrate-binding protein